MSAAPSSAGFSSATFSEFDQLTMESSPWDNFSMANDFGLESDVQGEKPIGVLTRSEEHGLKGEDKAGASGLLLMLLLFGAWVASRGAGASRDVLPAIPDEVRTASASVLDHIYKDSGISLEGTPQNSQAPQACNGRLAGSTVPPEKAALGGGGFEYSAIPHTPLDTLHHHLTAPTDQQLRDQAYSLTPTQYNDLMSDGTHSPNAVIHGPRSQRDLSEVLATVQTSGETAATLTRSLMYEKVPKQVLADFARMVNERKSGTVRP